VLFDWIQRQQKDRLLLFCNGWGMDSNPVRHLTADGLDLVILSDYRRLHLPAGFIDQLAEYATVYLVGWSMGVWAGQLLFSQASQLFTKTIAINGTLCPIDDELGIPRKIFFDTLASFAVSSRLKFYKRMCREKNNLEYFLSHQPQRELESQREELQYLADKVDCTEQQASIYRDVIISDSDWIFPTANQKRFWQGFTIHTLAGYHYPFLQWEDWEQLLDWVERE
jgi:biotin synthesis protein BioG